MGACALILDCPRAACGAVEEGWGTGLIAESRFAGFGKMALEFSDRVKGWRID